MAERLVLIVDASTARQDQLTVQDVFAHILDLFDLAVVSESDPEHLVVWRLIRASMNSPFRVEAEAVSVKPSVNVDVIARAQREEFVQNLAGLRQGKVPRVWSSGRARTKVQSVVRRTKHGIGRTAVAAGESKKEEIAVTASDLTVVEKVLGVDQHQPIPEATKLQQIGSIEGRLIEVGTHYSRPAICVEERKTKQHIWVTIPDNFRQEISREADFEDVWSGRRIVVLGSISYDAEGNMTRVAATEVHRVDPPAIEVSGFRDPNFTNGLSTLEYLEKLREGNLG